MSLSAYAVNGLVAISSQERNRQILDRVQPIDVTADDAAYVVLAESYGCALLTADRRRAATPGPTCTVTVLRD